MIPIMTFLSHSHKDREIARNLANELEKHNFKVFVAHDDIGIGTEGESKLKNEIDKRELFLVLLSTNFKTADFADHEVGIATDHNKRIFPIIIDDSKPYGFLSKYHGKRINPEIDLNEISKLVDELKIHTEEGKKEIDALIEKLLAAEYWRDANAIARELFEFTTFTPEQINNIAAAYVENFEINGSWTAGPLSLDLLSKNWNVVEQQFKKRLGGKLKKE